MPETTQVDAPSTAGDVKLRLRVEVYDLLAKDKGYRTVEGKARWHGIHRATLFDLRAGKTQPTMATALRMATDCGVDLEVIWQRLS